jgi:hypothetical protein
VRTLKGRAPAAGLRQGRLSEENNYHRQCHGGSAGVESAQVLDMKDVGGDVRTSAGLSAAGVASRFFQTGQTFATLQGDQVPT